MPYSLTSIQLAALAYPFLPSGLQHGLASLMPTYQCIMIPDGHETIDPKPAAVIDKVRTKLDTSVSALLVHSWWKCKNFLHHFETMGSYSGHFTARANQFRGFLGGAEDFAPPQHLFGAFFFARRPPRAGAPLWPPLGASAAASRRARGPAAAGGAAAPAGAPGVVLEAKRRVHGVPPSCPLTIPTEKGVGGESHPRVESHLGLPLRYTNRKRAAFGGAGWGGLAVLGDCQMECCIEPQMKGVPVVFLKQGMASKRAPSKKDRKTLPRFTLKPGTRFTCQGISF